MKQILWIICILCAGCATVTSPEPLSSAGSAAVPEKRPLPTWVAVSRLTPGISRQQAQALVGPTLVVGYEAREGAASPNLNFQPISVKNPYRSETFSKDGTSIVVDYYLTHTARSDGTVSNDELTPVVFENDRLTGQGWPFWDKTKQAHQIK